MYSVLCREYPHPSTPTHTRSAGQSASQAMTADGGWHMLQLGSVGDWSGRESVAGRRKEQWLSRVRVVLGRWLRATAKKPQADPAVCKKIKFNPSTPDFLFLDML